jgi:hypothetical protein
LPRCNLADGRIGHQKLSEVTKSLRNRYVLGAEAMHGASALQSSEKANAAVSATSGMLHADLIHSSRRPLSDSVTPLTRIDAPAAQSILDKSGAQLWRAVLSRPQHRAGCTFHGVTPDLQVIVTVV